MRYATYCRNVHRISVWTGGIAGGLLGFAWGLAKIGIGGAVFFGAAGAFVGTLLSAIFGWLLVPHVMVVSLGVLAVAALPFAVIWLAGLFLHLR